MKSHIVFHNFAFLIVCPSIYIYMMCRHAPYWITSIINFFILSALYFFFINPEGELMKKRMPEDINKGFRVWGESGKAKLGNRGCTLC